MLIKKNFLKTLRNFVEEVNKIKLCIEIQEIFNQVKLIPNNNQFKF